MDYEAIPLTGEEESLVEEKINEYADSMAPKEPHTGEDRLVFKVEDEEGNVIGGCVLNIHLWGRAVLGKLWVDKRYRHHGLGSMLIRTAENAAREKGCYYLCLGTMDFMARPLYEKHGFRVFTEIRNALTGHTGWSLSKRLDRDIPDYVPSVNTAAERYEVKPGTGEDAETISNGLDELWEEVSPDRHEYITLSRKLVDENGEMIAAIICGIDEQDTAEIDGIWVEEAYRRQGIGSRLIGDLEREAKETGACSIETYCCDWVSDFFFKNGFTPCGELEDYPRGHTAYELEKLI